MRPGKILDRMPAQIAVPLRARFGDRDPEVGLLDRFIAPGATVWDVGAHKGSYTWHLARLVGPAGTVHAFEPQPDLASRLERWAPDNVVVHAEALSNVASQAALTVPIWGTHRMQGHASLEAGRQDATSYEVQVRTVVADELRLSATFIKIDVEGHELSALQGAGRTLERDRPVLLMEIDYRHRSEARRRQDLLTWLSDHGYVAHYVRAGQLVRHGALTATTDPNDALSSPTYVYNWFLLPAIRS